MKRLLFTIALGLAVTAASSQAQSLNASQIQLTVDGSAVGTLSLPAGPAGTYTWTLPAASGVISLGGANSWTVGGQVLGATGLLGSQDAQQVDLITNNTTRMTLLGSTAAVLLPAQTELRLGDAAGGEYVALKSPATNKTSGYTFVMPDSLPGGEDVRLKVESIVGNVVTLGYTNPSTTGSIGYREAGQVSVTQGNTANDWTNIEGLNFTVGPDAIYSFESVIQLTGNANQGIKLRFGQPFGFGAKGAFTAVGGATIRYYVITLTENNIVGFGDQLGDADTPNNGLITGEIYIVKGYIETTNAVAANTPVQMLMRREDADEVTVTAKSSVQLITE